MQRGDHIRVRRPELYFHHGVYIGDGRVIEYTGDLRNMSDGFVRETDLAEFAKEGTCEVVRYERCLLPDEVVERARNRVGERRYCLVTNNCEHFARWCKTGDHESEQVNNVLAAGAGVSVSTGGTAGAMAAVSVGGAVAGLSGAGVMSGLASVGAAVGGGAVAGLAALGAAPGAAAVIAMHGVLRDDPALHQDERDARTSGRTASAVGAVVGTAGALATVSAAGSVAGLSAAGITTGLAAIGGTVGGGMAAGAAVTIAAPAVAAAAIGYGVYRAFRFFSD